VAGGTRPRGAPAAGPAGFPWEDVHASEKDEELKRWDAVIGARSHPEESPATALDFGLNRGSVV
jgi:hypothetical protein